MPSRKRNSAVKKVHRITEKFSGSFEPFHNRDLRSYRHMQGLRKRIADKLRTIRPIAKKLKG